MFSLWSLDVYSTEECFKCNKFFSLSHSEILYLGNNASSSQLFRFITIVMFLMTNDSFLTMHNLHIQIVPDKSWCHSMKTITIKC